MAKLEIPIQVNIPVEDLVEYLKKDGTLVEVVHCKECKYYDVNLADGTTCFCTRLELFNEYDWFCADGEEKSNG